jgi:hypothetical protein
MKSPSSRYPAVCHRHSQRFQRDSRASVDSNSYMHVIRVRAVFVRFVAAMYPLILNSALDVVNRVVQVASMSK